MDRFARAGLIRRLREPAVVAAQLGSALDGPSLPGLAGHLRPGVARPSTEVAAQGLTPAGPPGARYLGDDLDEEPSEELSEELSVPVDRGPLPSGPVEAGELPAGLLAATVHEGGYDGVEAACRSLGRWTDDQGRVLDGPAEELHLVAPGAGVPAHAHRTEIAWPVRGQG
ncbi:GyrI-like domain-containing protein [Kineococcus rhizosphaerae]|uniref:Effector-binding domain-containing protein n=1 Tax=Kineococcus rhizosphaerae TaxID=559628 RepID=A0A2T0QXB4_9ACTN|nr:GyrI-like domain-containing protein [Kineococcus rhizosphaerae]PRY10457.1 effector-binding domain-containing protein [Kineococcus rhizosphaerae]